tara:strand:- start:263 stop:1063 length:801 start_codon:yes stop_codon:yes gene_type:complete
MEYLDRHQLCKHLQELGKKWVFQGEEGQENDYKHWQGRISLWHKKYKRPLMKLFTEVGCPLPNYLEPTSGEGNQGFSYAMKADTRICGPWSDKDMPPYIPKQFRITNLRPFQQDIVNSATQWDTRRINVIIDDRGGLNGIGGNIGKTTIAHYAALNYGGIVIPPMNDFDKLVQAACCILRSKQQHQSCLIFIDIPRAIKQDNLPGLYAACEQIKVGYTFDWRNHYKYWYQDSPVVWVFTNKAPQSNWLTADRWNLWEVKDGVLLRR